MQNELTPAGLFLWKCRVSVRGVNRGNSFGPVVQYG